MKRSEMLLKLDEILLKLEGIHVVSTYINLLLTELEKAGMAPPEVIVLPDSYNRTEGTYGYLVHEWEDE